MTEILRVHKFIEFASVYRNGPSEIISQIVYGLIVKIL